MNNKLSLGTAKLGMPDYGYSDGTTLEDPTNFILKSIDLGIGSIDTSPRYGNSEELVGNALKHSKKKLLISTKIDGLFANSSNTPKVMVDSIRNSISKLNTNVDVCYLHQNDINIISDKYVHEGIKSLKSNNLINEVGTSVYSKEELQYTLDSGMYDWVQIPINILDTSFYNMIGSNRIKVAARSIFLQGIILDRGAILSDIKNNNELLQALEAIENLCNKYNISMRELSVAYLSALTGINKIIVGTTSITNLKTNLLSSDLDLNKGLISSITSISTYPKTWTNPRLWKS